MTDSPFFPEKSENSEPSPIVPGPGRYDVPPVTAWSFSRLSDFEDCNFRVLMAAVLKPPKGPELPPSHPLMIGQRTHEEAEYYINGTGPMTKSIKKMEQELDFCRAMYKAGNATVEENWGFDAAWDVTDWWGDDIWLRVKCDAAIWHDPTSMVIYDWKSGRSDGNEVKQMQQAQLYVAAAFMRFPLLEVVEVFFGFFKDGKIWHPRQTFTRDKAAKYIQRWGDRAGKLTSCTEFTPKPNRMNCKFCSFGPGEFGNRACPYGVEQ